MAHSYWSLFFVSTRVYIENVAVYTRRNAFFSGDILTLMASKLCVLSSLVPQTGQHSDHSQSRQVALILTNHNIILTLLCLKLESVKRL